MRACIHAHTHVRALALVRVSLLLRCLASSPFSESREPIYIEYLHDHRKSSRKQSPSFQSSSSSSSLTGKAMSRRDALWTLRSLPEDDAVDETAAADADADAVGPSAEARR